MAAEPIDARAEARATFRVTLTAKLTKSWNYVQTRAVGECTTSTRVVGTRTITLRSLRPTSVTATGSPGRMRFVPPVVGAIRSQATQRGSVTVDRSGCGVPSHEDCAVGKRTLTKQAVQFYRTRPGELSFRRTRDFGAGLSTTCPPQHPAVLVERPALRDAQGAINERQLFDSGIRGQSVIASFEEETVLEGNPEGKVVERVTWTLRFIRR